MDAPAKTALPAADDVIVCRVTRWYYRRMLILTAMLVGMGLYFLYDGKYGYPKANEIAAQKVWFEETVLKSYDEAKAAGRRDVWIEEARTQGWPTGTEGQPPRWVSWAAERGYPENPKPYTAAEIEQQFWLGGACILAGLIVALVVLRNRSRTVTARADHWVTEDGKTIRFADVFRLDLRKWPQKGLGYAWYRTAPDGPEHRAKLDDLKYSHMQLVLDRLRSQFKGELIEKVEEPAAPESGDEDQPVS